ncbi:MAG: hypothetical protein II174_03270, partial [Erysipelotrichaceae bacterium]|nr:hypothetical protein [Erysipelotrichaceae bacterium]
TLNVYISRGRNILLEDPKDLFRKDGITPLTWYDFANCNLLEEEARALCDKFKITYEVVYAFQEGKNNGDMISVRRWDDKPIKAGTYLPEDITVYITINDDAYKN